MKLWKVLKMTIKANIGCGKTPTAGWLNFDNSPALKLSRSPFRYWISKSLGLLSKEQIENIEWNKKNKINFADATSVLPFNDDTVDYIYTSHMIEHLSRSGVESFLKDTLRVLKSGGIIRISVPDLQLAINTYTISKDADAFMENILVEAPPISSLKQKFRLLAVGYRHHQWMYDGNSLIKLLKKIGYKNAEVCQPGHTNMSDPGGLNLYERSDQSVYVEATK